MDGGLCAISCSVLTASPSNGYFDYLPRFTRLVRASVATRQLWGPPANTREALTSVPPWRPGQSSMATVPWLGFFLRLQLPNTEAQLQREIFLETNQIHVHPTASLKDKAKPARTALTVGQSGWHCGSRTFDPHLCPPAGSHLEHTLRAQTVGST